MEKNQCDWGHETNLKVARLDTGNDSGLFLCPYHWEKEMQWRERRNMELSLKDRFDVLPFPSEAQ